MSLIDLYISDGGSIRRIGDNQHDMLTIEDGELCYYNLHNGDGCRLGEDGEWYKLVDNVDEYGYNCDPRKTESDSEIPNNCEHITEDGVTCAKYPACDDCLDNPLNKVKGSERLLKGKDEPTGYNLTPVDKDINVRSKDEPQTGVDWKDQMWIEAVEAEPQTDGILFKGNLKEGDYKLIKTTNGWVLEGNDIAYYGEPQTKRSE